MIGWHASVRAWGAGCLLCALASCAKLAGLEGIATDEAIPKPIGTPFPVNQLGAEISPQKLKITTGCKVADQSQYITIENKSDKALDYEVMSPTPNTVGLLDGDSGPVAVSVKGTLAAKKLKLVRAYVLAPTAATTQAEIIVTTGEIAQRIPVDIVVTGGSLAIAPGAIDFGQVKAGTTPPDQTVELQNTGTDAVTITSWTGATPSDFLVGGGSLTVRAGEKTTAAISFAPGPQGAPVTATLTPNTQVPMCTDPPAIAVKGQRVNLQVTVGPGSLDLKTAPCGSSPSNQDNIQILNFSDQTAELELAMLQAGPSHFVVPKTASAPPAQDENTPGRALIPVRLSTPVGDVPGRPITESIQVNVRKPEPSTAIVTATFQIRGAVLDIAPTALTFGPNGTSSFTITNTGNFVVFLRETTTNGIYTFLDGTDQRAVNPPGFFGGNSTTIKLKLNATIGGEKADIKTAMDTSVPLANGPICNNVPVVKCSGPP